MSENHSGFEYNKTKGIVEAITDRKISKETAKKYNTQVNKTGNTITQHIYQYFDKDGNYIANKVRDVQNKRFWSEGNLGVAGLFGQNIFNQSGKYVTVCEGEVDAMSAYEMLGSRWPVVSVKNGAASVKADISNKDVYDFLMSFDSVIICFDNDAAGKVSSAKLADLLAIMGKFL